MTPPLYLQGIPLIDAFFESVSGITTTGLTTRASVAGDSPALGFLRAWMQFYGGLGFAVLSLALLRSRSVESRRLLDPAGDEDLATGTRTHARHITFVYAVLSAAAVALLWASGLDLWNALLHALTVVSTGGFSSFDESLARTGPPVRVVAATLSLLAALPLVLYYRAATKRQPSLLWKDPEFKTLFGATALVTLLLVASDGLTPLDALFQAANAQTTTGFSSLEPKALSDAGKLALILSMATGAGLGSTGGGFKLIRVLVLFRLLQLILRRALLPRHAVDAVRVAGVTIDDAQVLGITGIVLLYVAIIMVSWALFVAVGHPPLDSLFEVVSATATAGLSAGISSPELAPWLKGVLCFDMLAGRLEVLALLVVLAPRNWLRTGA